MRTFFNKSLVIIMIFTLIGSATVGAAPVRNEQTSISSYEALTRVSTFAGNGDFDDWDGAALKASFRMPQGVAVLKDGSVLVADSRNHLIRKVSSGTVSTYAGFILEEDESGNPTGGWHDGAAQAAVFNGPSGMDTDLDGNIYIADSKNHLIRKISGDGTVSTMAGDGILGQEDGTGSKARFYHPQDVAVAGDGNIYVADTLNHLIRKISPGGQVTTLNAPSDRVVEVIAAYAVPAGDYADGELSVAKFNEPTSIAIDNKGNLYVSDTGNHVIRYIDLAKGTVTTAAGLSQGETPVYAKGALYAEGSYGDGASSEARFHSPKGIAITAEQGLLIADSANHTIRYLVNGQVSTIAGVPEQFGQVDGINGHNLLQHPMDVAVLPNGNLLIADSYNNKIRELEVYKLPSDLAHNDQVKVVLEDQTISFDAQPEMVRGHTMVPVKAISEIMGYTIEYKDTEGKIELIKGDVRIGLQVGNRVMTTINSAAHSEEQQEMEAAPYMKAGRFYVPVRFFSEAFGLDARWDRNTRTVILREIATPVEKLPATDRSSRIAVLEQIKGTVWVNQAGGFLTYRAYNGMNLSQGDQIITEFNSSAILKTADRKDEITISENSELYISNLRNVSLAKHTSFDLRSGLVGASVSSLVDSKDTFKITTPTAVTNVRGTQLYVGIDPNTGSSSVFVGSGLVQTGGNGTAQNPGLLYPGQQISIVGPGIEQPSEPYMGDLNDFFNLASPAIIEQMLKNKQQLDQENAAMIEKMKEGLSGSNLGGNPFGQSEDDLEQYKNNLNNLIAIILKQARDQQIIDPDQLQALINEANKQSDHKIDLSKVPALSLTEQQKQQQEKQKQLEEARKKLQEEQDKMREQQREQAEQSSASLKDKLLAEKARLEQENKKKLEEAAKRADDLLKQGLSEADKQQFEEKQQALERQKQQQQEAQRPQAPIPTVPTPAPSTGPAPSPNPTPNPEPRPPTNTAPVVINAIADRWVNSEASFQINVSEVFHDADGDTLTFTVTSSDTDIAEVKVEGAIVTLFPNGMGSSEITISATDGKGGVAETTFHFGLYHGIALNAESTPNSINLDYLDYWEDEITYHIYINDVLFESTTSQSITIPELEPNTDYALRVTAVNIEGKVVGFADLSVTTLNSELQESPGLSQ